MGLDVSLETEKGDIVDSVPDASGRLARLLPPRDPDAYPFLRYVDDYGDTVFNRLQMAQVIPELEQLAGEFPADSEILAAVHALAERCAREIHLYLRFYGD
jgi:hypothetical protein